MKISLFVILILYLSESSFSQNFYSENYKFIGYIKKQPIFRVFEDVYDGTDIFKISEGDFGLYRFSLHSKRKLVGKIIYLQDKVSVTFSYDKENKGDWLRIYYDENLIDSVFTRSELIFAFSEKNNSLFLSTGDSNETQLSYVNFYERHPRLKFLPLHGRQLYVVNDFLYFSYDRRNKDYSPYLDDIFRVKIGDWNNPELILKGSEIRDWFVFPTGDVIYIRTDLGKGKREIDMLFNIMTNTYAELGRVGFKYPAYLSLDNIDYFIKSKKIKGIKSLYLVPLPKLPTSYPYKDTRRILPREVWYNLPLIEKIFNGTFITPGLLRGAPREELEKLEKSQLRLLRNAIYAQQAFIFQSKDLQDFFNQFEWYRMMTNKKTSNEDVVLLPEDEERANLMLEIEQSK